MIKQISTINEQSTTQVKEEGQKELIISMHKLKHPEDYEQLQEYLNIHSETIDSVSLREVSNSNQYQFQKQLIERISKLQKVKKVTLDLPRDFFDERLYPPLCRYPLLESLTIIKTQHESTKLFSSLGKLLLESNHLLNLNLQIEGYSDDLINQINEFVSGLSSCIHLETFKFAYESTIYDSDLTPQIIRCLGNLQNLKQIKFQVRRQMSGCCNDALSLLLSLPLLEKLKIYLTLMDTNDDKQAFQQNDVLREEKNQLKSVSKNLRELMLKLKYQYTVDSQIPYIGNIPNLQILTLHICSWDVNVVLANEFYSSISKLEQLIEVNLLFSQLKTNKDRECSFLLGYSFSKMKKLKRMQLFHQSYSFAEEELQVFLINFGKGISPVKNLITFKLAITRFELSQYSDYLYNFRKIQRLSQIQIR